MHDQTDLSSGRLVQLLDQYLYGWAYKDIERASIHGSAKLTGFILGACFINAMASFYSGVAKETAKKGSGKRFNDFVVKAASPGPMETTRVPEATHHSLRPRGAPAAQPRHGWRTQH